MKTEEFDDAIKRKLESINPAFTEKDIDRVHKYTVANRSPFYPFTWIDPCLLAPDGYGYVGDRIGNLEININVVHDQHPVPIVQTQAVAPYKQNTNPTQIIAKTDTVYLTKYKYVNKYHDSYVKPSGSLNKNRSTTNKQYAQLQVVKTI